MSALCQTRLDRLSSDSGMKEHAHVSGGKRFALATITAIPSLVGFVLALGVEFTGSKAFTDALLTSAFFLPLFLLTSVFTLLLTFWNWSQVSLLCRALLVLYNTAALVFFLTFRQIGPW